MGEQEIDTIVMGIKLLTIFIAGMIVTNMYGPMYQPFFIWCAVLGILIRISFDMGYNYKSKGRKS